MMKVTKRYFVLLIVAAGIAACGSYGPAPIRTMGSSGTLEGVYATVERGDSVYVIARRHGTTMRAIIDANRLTPPYVLQPGQRLLIPGGTRYIVRRGDTLYAISRAHGVDMTGLARLNNLEAPYLLQVNQMLRIPSRGGVRLATRSTALPRRRPNFRTPVPPAGGRDGGEPVTVREADIPNPRPSVSVPSPNLAVTPPGVAVSPADVPRIRPDFDIPEPTRRETAAPRIERVPPQGGQFGWPVEGRVVMPFGPREGGLHNDGINIAVPHGVAVYAAESGVVGYAGNELAGYGELLLIRHDSGWVTAYAHNSELLVARGDRVRRAQVIARAGATGNVQEPQLHFEIRRGIEAVNPVELLAAAEEGSPIRLAADRDGARAARPDPE